MSRPHCAGMAQLALVALLLWSPGITRSDAASTNVTVPAASGPPGVLAMSVRHGTTIEITATGRAQYGSDAGNCGSMPYTDPDGQRYPSATSPKNCGFKHDKNAFMASAPVGALLGQIAGPSRSTRDAQPWFVVGSHRVFTTSVDGFLHLLYNASQWKANSGSYAVGIHSCDPTRPDDVPASNPFATYIYWLLDHGIMSGYADCTFRPFSNVTEITLLRTVVLGLNLPIPGLASSRQTFADVPPTFPLYPYYEAAVDAGVVNGYSCGGSGEPCDAHNRPYARPFTYVTRGQMVKTFVFAKHWSLVNPVTSTFTDLPPDAGGREYAETASAHNLVSGYSCGSPGEPCDSAMHHYFRPNQPLIRGQLAKAIYLAVH